MAKTSNVTPAPTNETAPATAKGRKRAPENETPEDTFRRLANSRVNNALNEIRLVGNLGGGNYKYSEDQIEVIFETLSDALYEAKAKFAPKAKGERSRFAL